MNVPLTLPRPRLLEPGRPRFEPGTERYVVAGGGALVLRLFAGDRLAITDREGLQACEIAAFAADGRPDLGALGLDPAAEAPGINRLLAGDGAMEEEEVAALRRHGLPARVDRAAVLFGAGSAPGETVELAAERDVACVLHAPGGPMLAFEQNPPTELAIVVRRARVANMVEPPLPKACL